MSNATSVPTNAVVPCPRCKKPLVDPGGLGWCSGCGYCRSLEDSNKEASRPDAPTTNTLAATGTMVGQTPFWLWVTIIGLAAVVVGTLMVGRFVVFSPFGRALLTTLQIAAGVSCMFVGQFIGLIRVAPDDPSLTFKDAIFPFRLYGFIMKRLPDTQLTVYLGAWGLAAAISAGVFIGGVDHWLTYLPGYKSNAGKVIPKAPKR